MLAPPPQFTPFLQTWLHPLSKHYVNLPNRSLCLPAAQLTLFASRMRHVYRTWRDIARRSQPKFWSVYTLDLRSGSWTREESRRLLLLVQEFIGPDCPRHFTRGLSSRTSYPIKRPRDLLPPPAFSHPGNSLQTRQDHDSILRSHHLFRPSAPLVYHHGSRENWPAQCSNWN
jgi:hypothetical protein